MKKHRSGKRKKIENIVKTKTTENIVKNKTTTIYLRVAVFKAC